jgi:hypothetical protein
MPRVSIQLFRAALAGCSANGVFAGAYRELTRRPELAARMVPADWIPWTGARAAAA